MESPDGLGLDEVTAEEYELIMQLAIIIGKGMGQRSKWALGAARDARTTDGIAGLLVLKIPSKVGDFVDVTFTCGIVEVVSRWT